MTLYKVMLSEYQERMLAIVKKGCEDKVRAIFDKLDLRSDIIGEVTDDGMAIIKESERLVAKVPIKLLTTPPLYRPKVARSAWLVEMKLIKTAALTVPASGLSLASGSSCVGRDWQLHVVLK